LAESRMPAGKCAQLVGVAKGRVLGLVLPAEHLILAVGWCSAGPGQDLAETDELAVGRWVKLVGQD
jgi:hypothetical protein